MINILTFASVHKSITQLAETSLPNFVVLTGLNGSGKTHLLTAIAEGKIRSSLVADPQTDVRLFDSTTIIPTDTGAFDPFQNQSQRSQWFRTIQTGREQHLPQLQQFMREKGIPAQYCLTLKAAQSLTVEKLRETFTTPGRAEELFEELQGNMRAIEQQIYNHAYSQNGDEQWRKTLPKVRETCPQSLLAASYSSFFDNGNFLWGEVDVFKQAFGRVFTTYRELIHENDRLRQYPPPDDKERRSLSTQEFFLKYGCPPWEFVNQILEVCRLDFRVDHPPMHETASYEPKLQKLSTPIEMRFQDLSSGEKVLMSFALCLYNSQDGRQSKVFPKLLLLDEVDAPLHPSMTKSLLDTIQNVLVKDKGVAVILTTHSPSTVALAPEEAIYSMEPSGPAVQKISKSRALSLLTMDVPTLSVSFDGRRQIFVESLTDACLYDSLYQRFKGQLASERSLVFIQVGKKDNSGGEKNAGCDQVIRLVNDLVEGGNLSVLGLVDWDGKHSPSGRLHVLAPNIRDGLESLLFDPVLLVALIAREDMNFGKAKSLFDPSDTYISLVSWDAARWQRAVDVAQNFVLKQDVSKSDLLSVKYLNGMTLSISKQFLHLDDHALEGAITDAFGFLVPIAKGRTGALMKHVCETVLTDFPALLPSDLLETFTGLLESEMI